MPEPGDFTYRPLSPAQVAAWLLKLLPHETVHGGQSLRSVLYELSGSHHKLPSDPQTWGIHTKRVAVKMFVWNAGSRRKNELRDELVAAAGHTFVVSDTTIPGPASLFLVAALPDRADVLRWMDCMPSLKMIISEAGGLFFVASPVSAFARPWQE